MLVSRVDRLEGEVAAAQSEAAEAVARRQEAEGEVGRLRLAVEERERAAQEAERRWGGEVNRREAAWAEERAELQAREQGVKVGWMCLCGYGLYHV